MKNQPKLLQLCPAATRPLPAAALAAAAAADMLVAAARP